MKLLAAVLTLLLPAQSAFAQAGAFRSRRRAGRAERAQEPAKREPAPKEETKAAPKRAEKADERPGNPDAYSFTEDVKAVAFSRDGRFAAARGADGGPDRIKVWDVKNRRMHRVFDVGWSGNQDALAFSPDGDTLASADGTDVSLFDLETGQRWRKFEDKSPSSGPVAFGPNTKFFSAVMGRRVMVWPLEQKRRNEENALLEWPEDSQLRALDFSPDGKKLAAIGFRSPRRTRGQIEILDPAGGAVLKTLQEAEIGLLCGGFSPNGRVLAAGGVRPTPEGPRAEIVFWSTRTWKVIRRIAPGIKGEVYGIAFSPDGLSLAAVIGGYRGMPVFDLRTGKLVKTMPGVDVERHGSVAVSPDGKLVSASAHKEVRFWTAAAVFGGGGKAAPKRTAAPRRAAPARAAAPEAPPAADDAAMAPLGSGETDAGPVDAGEAELE